MRKGEMTESETETALGVPGPGGAAHRPGGAGWRSSDT